MNKKTKSLKNPLRRRYLRELKNDAGKYIVIFLLMVITIGFVSGFLVADGSMMKAYNEGFEKYRIENGHFAVKDPLTETERTQMEDLGIAIFDLPYINEDAPNGGTLRIYPDRTQVNLICLMEGQMPAGAEEIAIDRMYADNNHYRVGDQLVVEEVPRTITGLVAFPDYSCLYENNNDAMFDSILFGTAIVSEEGFETLFTDRQINGYAWLYNQQPADVSGERTVSEDLMKQMGKIATLTDFVPRYANQAINFAGEDMGSDKVMMEVFLYIIIVILAFVFAITISNTIFKDATVIGTLRATGYTKRELILHYMTLPAIVTLVSALVGNLLGYTFFRTVCVDMYYGSYCLPTYVTIWSAEAFLKTTLIPFLIMLFITWFMLRRSLAFPPLKFLRRDLSRKQRSKAVHLSHKIPFLRRFRLRVILRNLPGYITLLLGIFFALTLLLFGMMMPSILNNYQSIIEENMLSNYQYILTIPTEIMADDNPLNGIATMIRLRAAVHTDNPDAEAFSAYSLTTLPRSGFRQEDISLYGISENSRYIDLHLTDEDVYISSAYGDKYGLKPGDTITLKESYGDETYDFTVSGILPYNGAVSIFMTRPALNAMLGLSSDFFMGYFSDTAITDIDPKYIGTVIDVNTLTRISRQLRVSMGDMMYMLDGFSILIFLILVYLIARMIIDRNALPISMLKILGSTNPETAALYMIPTAVVTILGIFITLPLVSVTIRQVFMIALRMMIPGWMPLIMDRMVYLRMVLYSIAAFAVVAFLQLRRVKAIPMDATLKNAE